VKRTLAEMMSEAANEAAANEIACLDMLIAAHLEETGTIPVLEERDGRTWCCYSSGLGPGALSPDYIADVAAKYREQTDIPASKAVLVREFPDLRITWRWEERK
jgi:hypothetical protein